MIRVWDQVELSLQGVLGTDELGEIAVQPG